MPRSSTTALYTRVDNSFSNPVVGTTIDPTHADTFFDDVESAVNAFIATSASSVAIGTGSKTFTVASDVAGKAFLPGTFVHVWSRADTADYMFGTVTSYSTSTGALVINSVVTGGTGTNTDWNIQQAGARGAQGAASGLRFNYSTTTTDSDPGAGVFRLNHATIASATAAYIDNADNGGNSSTTYLDTFDDSTSTVKGHLFISGITTQTAFAIFEVSGSVTDGTGYRKLTLTHVASGGTFTNGEEFCISFARAGNVGATGTAATIAVGTTTTGAEGTSASVANSGSSSAATFDFTIPRGATPAVAYTFSTTTTDSDPGNGIVRFNNATPASITTIYFDNLDADGNTVTAWLDTMDDSTDASHKGFLTFTDVIAPATKIGFNVTGGSVVDGTGYRKVTVTHSFGTTLFTNARRLAVAFDRTGNKGSDGAGVGDVTAASTFGTDNVIIRSDGTSKGVQSSAVAIDDATGTLYPTVSDSGALGSTTKMWGDLFLASGGVVNFNNGNAMLTHSSGLITSNVPFSIGTSNALTCGTVELGASADTTLARVSAGKVSIEGDTIATLAANNAFTGANTFDKTQAALSGTITDNSAADFSTKQSWVADVNGSAFDLLNPSAAPTNDKTFISILFTYTTSHGVTAGSKFKSTGWTPTASAGKKDQTFWRYDSTADQYWLVGARLDVAS